MTPRSLLLSLCLMSAALLVFFQIAQRQLANPWEQLVLDSEFRDVILTSMSQERHLATLEPDQAARHKHQFQKAQSLLAHLEILEANRHKITWRYHAVLLALLGGSLGSLIILLIYRRYRLEGRLRLLGAYLARLAQGETDLQVKEMGNDVLGRIGQMIQTTSTVMTRASQRLKALDHLEAWQESSRRMAHEIRTPLTTLRLEVDKLIKVVHAVAPGSAATLIHHEQSIREELSHLATFTEQYTSFAKIGKPQPKILDALDFLQEFLEIYHSAWPNLSLRYIGPGEFEAPIEADKRLIRQVLVNLCNNSSKALADENGYVDFDLSFSGPRLFMTVVDNGPGVDPALHNRIFQPYVTTRAVGEGTGLGLAISRKIMLDHGGDLELIPARGAGFRLIFPIRDQEQNP